MVGDSGFLLRIRKSTHVLIRSLAARVRSVCKSCCNLVWNFYYFCLLHVNSFLFQVCYFFLVSVIGFVILKALKPRCSPSYGKLDLFFMAVSATTVSSMSTVEMEVLSNSQLIIMTILMLIGGEVFTSMVGLGLKGSKLRRPWKSKSRVNVLESLPPDTYFGGSTSTSTSSVEMMGSSSVLAQNEQENTSRAVEGDEEEEGPKFNIAGVVLLKNDPYLRYRSIKLLGRIVCTYFVLVQALGIIMVVSYISISSSATNVLKKKGLELSTFSIFTVVSTFASCGFVPTNENMMIFSKNSGLLLILIPQILLGNTLFPPCLRFLIWGFGKLSGERSETEYLLRNTEDYLHLLPGRHSLWLVYTVLGFIGVQFVVLCAAEWNSQVLSGLTVYEKLVGALFQCVNTRHTGETIVDLSAVAPVVLVLFVAMMYLPPYTAVIPLRDDTQDDGGHLNRIKSAGKTNRNTKLSLLLHNFLFSQLSYLLIFVLVLCITERNNLQKDPLNFNVFNIVVETISAYGNVGFSTGYSCSRRLSHQQLCVDRSYGFSGKWTSQGKITLIFVMVFGRLKKFNMQGGKAWKLL